MAKSQQLPELPLVGIVTDDEITQAIGNDYVKKLGVDPDSVNCEFKVTYRNVKNEGGGYRLFASIAVTNIQPIDPAMRESRSPKSGSEDA